jgi:uncharacterized phage protein (TIGR01671 family)
VVRRIGMREIKFRAWDKSQNKMYQVRGINFDNEDLWLKINETQIMGANLFEVELMQYTGLKDKNGKEICQGDIVECKCGNTGKTILRQVEYIGVSFCTKNGSFYNQKTKQREYCYIPLKPYVKVVGNIYENPELLKEGE